MNNTLFYGIIAAIIILIAYRRISRKVSTRAPPPEVPMTDWTPELSRELAELALIRVFSDQDPDRIRLVFSRFNLHFPGRGMFAISPDASRVREMVRSIFPEEHQADVLQSLAQYGCGSFELEPERIRIDVIKASEGDYSRIAPLVKQAKADFRGLVMLAESPNSMRDFAESAMRDHDSEVYKNNVDADLRQYVLWLLQYV